MEHTVVRGSNKGKLITSTMVYHGNEQLKSLGGAEFDYALMGDPPDIAKEFTNLAYPPDEDMLDTIRLSS
nr:uncharacterized protein LOC109179535 isoform X2 [Ipomoea trifida]